MANTNKINGNNSKTWLNVGAYRCNKLVNAAIFDGIVPVKPLWLR